jgi:probable HAF family extracellular repeat protein
VDSSALGVSSNGIVVVGSSVGNNGREAVRWSDGTITALGHLPSQPVESLATAASADGGVIVGVSRMTNSSGEAFRWTLSGGMIGLGDLPGGVFSSSASGVTPDGAIVVGTSISSSSWEAYRWTQSGGMVGLGDLPGADAGGPNQSTSGANGVSADGAVIVGWSYSDWMVGEGFRWSGSFAALGDFPGGEQESIAHAISADGSVIVGAGDERTEPFRWTQGAGMAPLRTPLPDGGPVSAARAASANGAVIVGSINDIGDLETGRAFRWTQANGVESVSALLQAGGVDLTGWQLTEATGVSADGSIIVGNGLNPSGNPEAWRAFIPFQCVPQAAQLKFWARFYASAGEADQIAGLMPTSVNSNGVQHAPISMSGHPGGMAQFVLNGGRLIYTGGQGSPFGIRQRNFTIAAWVNIPSHMGRNAIVDTRRSAQAPHGVQLFTENGMLGFRMQDDAGGAGEWITQTNVTGGAHHVAVTVVRGNPNGGSIYVDGARVQVGGQWRFDPTSVPGSLGGNNPLRVGHDAINSEPGQQFDVDEVQVYWRPFPQPDMHQLFVLPTCSG